MSDLRTVVPKNVYSLRHSASFYPFLVSFRLQIAYRKVRISQIGVNKLVGRVLINLLRAKFIVSSCLCIISIIIINVPAVSRFTGIFVTTAALLCQRVIVNSRCKSAAAQYKQLLLFGASTKYFKGTVCH